MVEFTVSTLVAALLGFMVVFLFSLVSVLTTASTSRTGLLGMHTYSIEEAGFRAQTDAGDSLTFSSAIDNIERTRSVIVVHTSPWFFEILPRHGFDSDAQFEAFYSELNLRAGR